jgi:aminoglycoside 3-N-acetyltransferase
MVHSSLSALGWVPGGAKTVIDALLQALGPEGTLLMPALTYLRVTRAQPHFDVRNTPSNVGRIPETFRLRPDVMRSVHPTHSVCGLGPLAAALLQDHPLDDTPCGPRSPFHLLPQLDGQILMLGCGLSPNTSFHAMEEVVQPPYLFSSPILYSLTFADGATVEKCYTPHNFHGWIQRYERAALVLGPPGLRTGKALQGQAHLLDAEKLWDAALNALRCDPLFFVEKEQTWSVADL